ncbi:polysaccharide deacetylase family protein [Acetanaerobacterium elongatum]|uniref:Polysaccharide deacetylase family sporulation protein PdaB n=1 Tax=Acetanaerobacterium elongatum TaxID=258515 RepID=A0A1H0A5G3_9FIRM|nr:polysaccharide deacetylase family protein [Acetanaerobacterium elongatum]SDN28798.1 polysaccharide deacetylase family sporulation protein PdaB [Acetanaerobacterium elongatum]
MKRYLMITKKHLAAGILALAGLIILVLIAGPLEHIAVPAASYTPAWSFDRARQLPIYGVATEKKQLAITFNAAWEADDIPALLALLKQQDVVSTFFLVGQWAEKNPREAKLIAEAGHEIGNHSYAHPDMTKLTASQIEADITKADAVIQQATGVFPKYFRAPSGSYNDTVIELAKKLNHIPVQWTIDSLDWKKPSPDEIATRVLKEADNGSIILFHTAIENTRTALPGIIASLRKQGYSFVKVSELIYTGDYTIDYQGIQHTR